MKILNIASIIPLKGLKRENDIVLRIQEGLFRKFHFESVVIRTIPYSNRILALLSPRWKAYYDYRKRGVIKIDGVQIYILSQLTLPSSNFWLKWIFFPFNYSIARSFYNRNTDLFKGADLLLAQNLMPDSFVAYTFYRWSSIPYILNARGYKRGYIEFYPVRKYIRNSSAIISHSSSVLDDLSDIGKTLKFIPHPFDKSFYFRDRSRFRNLEKIHFITVCRLLSLKNIDWVIKALGAIKGKLGRRFNFTIIGDGPELHNLQKLVIAKNLTNQVYFLGYLSRSDIIERLKYAHVFIMPSFPETYGRAFIEAAAAGCLVVGHERTGVYGLLPPDSAIFVNKQSIQNILERIIQDFKEEDFAYYSQNAYKILLELDESSVLQKYREIYESAVGSTSTN